MQKIQTKAIILDMKLPGINGWTVLNWLKKTRITTHSCTRNVRYE
jgi:CheY-like chemotaxis protein